MNAALDLYEQVLSNPWADLPRIEFARSIETTDPAHAKFTQLGLQLAAARRRRYSYDDITTLEADMRLSRGRSVVRLLGGALWKASRLMLSCF